MPDLHEILVAYETANTNPNQTMALGPSSTSLACRRQAAFHIHGHHTDPGIGAHTVGTALHSVVATAWLSWAAAHGYQPGELVVEQTVEIPGLPRSGQADVVDHRRQQVRDLKTAGRQRFDSWLDTGPPEHMFEQVMIYALGIEADDMSWTVVIDGWCRETGRTHSWTRPYSKDVAIAAVERIAAMDEYLRHTLPLDVPADGKGRGSFPCSYCPFTEPCLGPDDRPALHHPDSEHIQLAATRYLEANLHIKALEAIKEKARADLGDAEGTYGERRTVLATLEGP